MEFREVVRPNAVAAEFRESRENRWHNFLSTWRARFH